MTVEICCAWYYVDWICNVRYYFRLDEKESPKGSVIVGPDGVEILVGGAISAGPASSVDADEKKSDGSESQKALEVDGMCQRVPSR